MGNNPGPINGPRNRGYRECFDQRRLLEGGGNVRTAKTKRTAQDQTQKRGTDGRGFKFVKNDRVSAVASRWLDASGST